ncbi:TerC family protein [Ignatzschineria rhizosphaerae]|uniref:TerC family protein n=2 Tax=Ignatzschineria rhizosphaerae TaxID=2923279 RepID=A0ABY3X3U2_9GAMM|nr:TerC family protein [Ignatzschineria rhizosphaerae]
MLYLVFGIVVSIMILIDMFALKASGDHKVSAKEALTWTIIWISVALLFDLGLWAYIKYMIPAESIPLALGDNSSYALDKALEFLTGYVVEKSLSIDNIFIFLLIFSYFKVPNIYQRRVLVYGVLAAVFLRVVMVLIGSYLISKFEWILYLFGAFLLFTGIKMCFGHDEEADLSQNKIVKITKKFFKTTDDYHKEHFFIFKDGIKYATPLFIVLVLITISDIIFAVDSVPAVFAVTTDPFIVMTSNVFAILGLRAMYFLLADMAERFHLLQYGLAIILIFIGIKMLILYFDYHFPTALSLSVILGTLIGSIVLSLLFPKKGKIS